MHCEDKPCLLLGNGVAVATVTVGGGMVRSGIGYVSRGTGLHSI